MISSRPTKCKVPDKKHIFVPFYHPNVFPHTLVIITSTHAGCKDSGAILSLDLCIYKNHVANLFPLCVCTCEAASIVKTYSTRYQHVNAQSGCLGLVVSLHVQETYSSQPSEELVLTIEASHSAMTPMGGEANVNLLFMSC